MEDIKTSKCLSDSLEIVIVIVVIVADVDLESTNERTYWVWPDPSGCHSGLATPMHCTLHYWTVMLHYWPVMGQANIDCIGAVFSRPRGVSVPGKRAPETRN